ncbi:MAG: AAA domain-containing protein, partial [Bacteroidota bacterium]
GLEASKSKRFIWNKIRFGLYRMRANKVAPLWELYDDLQRKLRYKNHLIKAYIRTANDYYLYEMLQKSRKELQVFLKGLRARTGSLKEERFKQVNFDTLFSALPIWLVTMEEVSQVLPLEKELFDLVIFDEATQCNISSALPILQRGKRAVIVGDPKQLRHISFLSTHRQEQLLKQYKLPPEDIYDLDYRNKSLLDFTLDQVENQRDIHFLNEHYRSLPDLINFSNQRFYDSAISLMTDTPTAKTKGNLHLVSVNGKRVGKGVNEIEVQAIIEQVRTIAERDKSLDPTLCKTIGILSPFREQSDFIYKAIQAVFSLEQIKRHEILVGTPHFFQGEERDIMLLSFALDEHSHPSAFRYLEKVDVFNVSITRSRIAQYLYISFEPKQLAQESLLKAYLSSIQQETNSSKGVPSNVELDVFMEEVVVEIKKLDFQQIYFNYHIANLDIDIVVIRNDKTYCIDLVGYPGEYEAAFPIERIKVFNRMDLKVLSIPYLYWTLDQDKCVEAIHRFLNTEEDM